MNIGIIGNGKMGREIFNHLLQFEHQLFLICKDFEEIEGQTALIEKNLKKMFTRGYLTESEYVKKQQSYTVSNDLTIVKDCELIIESIFEQKELKQEIFQRLETLVHPECILATNTSSIPLASIFEGCTTLHRCMGIHFFFPVKVTRTVEINYTRLTDEKYVRLVHDLLIQMEKRPIELKEGANMILSNLLITMITQIYNIYEEKYLSIEEIDQVLKAHLVTYGLFEIIDSTGINIVLKTLESFINDRFSKLYTPFRITGQLLLANGYGGGPGNKGIYAYQAEHPVTRQPMADVEIEQYKKDVVLRMQSLLLNEIAFLVQNALVDKDQINEAVQEVLGLSEDPISMLKNVGNEKIEKCLLDTYQRLQDPLYQVMDLSVLTH